MAEVVDKLRAAAKEHFVAATRPIHRVLTHLEIHRRSSWLERGIWLETLANDLENDNLAYGLNKTKGQEDERTKQLLKETKDG